MADRVLRDPKLIYVASSWRNPMQPAVVKVLEAARFNVYDFRNPDPGDHGFRWSQIDEEWLSWSPERYVQSLEHPIAVEGYGKDMAAMEAADTFVLVLPCGRSAHLELGWAVGQGKQTAILLGHDEFEPELMYRMVDFLAPSTMDLLAYLGVSDGWGG